MTTDAQVMPGSEPREQDEVALVEPPGGRRVGEPVRDGPGRGVADAVEHDDGALHRQADPLVHRLDDAEVRLVRHEKGDVVGRASRRGEDLADRVDLGAHGAPVDLPAVHLDVPADLRVEKRCRGPVGSEVVGEDEVVTGARLEDDGAGAVAEEDRRRPVLEVRRTRQRVGPDDEGAAHARR